MLILPTMSSASTDCLPPYVGRFAPSPSGPLHFGSLVAALGSFLQARKNSGRWLVRIEDIDPPREVPGATEQILDTLYQHQLFWDETPLLQSQRSALYEQKIAWLVEQGLTYYCHCSRAELATLSNNQLCACARQQLSPRGAAIRFKNLHGAAYFDDRLQQRVWATAADTAAQFAIKRKDGLYAYQLAVVVDDISQGISEVVRGADLLHATFYQLSLYQAFGVGAPQYLHLPVVEGEPGKKLSKQNHAEALENRQAQSNIFAALQFLGMQPDGLLRSASVSEQLAWAIDAWDVSRIPVQLAAHDNRINPPESI